MFVEGMREGKKILYQQDISIQLFNTQQLAKLNLKPSLSAQKNALAEARALRSFPIYLIRKVRV